MTTTRTFGRYPTLGEMKEYYTRKDVLDFLYDECRLRNIAIAFRRKRWHINPQSKAHLREIIEKTIENKIEMAYAGIETEFFLKTRFLIVGTEHVLMSLPRTSTEMAIWNSSPSVASLFICNSTARKKWLAADRPRK